MRSALIRDYTRILGKAQGYEPLVIRDETVPCSVGGQVPCMTSEYDLSIAEIQQLIEGGRIRLQIQGTEHPPVRITVVDPIEDLHL